MKSILICIAIITLLVLILILTIQIYSRKLKSKEKQIDDLNIEIAKKQSEISLITEELTIIFKKALLSGVLMVLPM